MTDINIFNLLSSGDIKSSILSYIMQHANKEYQTQEKALHNISVKFLDSIFEKANIPKPEHYENIETNIHYLNIHVLCRINDKYYIIDYRNSNPKVPLLNNMIKNIHSDNIVMPLLFNIEDHIDGDSDIYKDHYIYRRNSILDIFLKYDGSNNIINDFIEYLQIIDNKSSQYQDISIYHWSRYSWGCFLSELKNEIPDASWGLYRYRKDKCLLFSWDFHRIDQNHSQFLQINHCLDQVVIKLYSHNDQLIDNQLFYKWKYNITQSINNINIVKSPYIKNNLSPCLGFIDYKFRATTDNNHIDLNKTVENLKEISEVMQILRKRMSDS